LAGVISTISMIGKSAKIVKDVQTSNGMLYKGTTVKIIQQICTCKQKENIAVEHVGRRYWLSNSDILVL